MLTSVISRAIVRHQVIGGHLVPPPRTVGDEPVDIIGRIDDDVARARQAGEAAGRSVLTGAKLRRAPADEFIDIAVVVGEQDEALRMFRRRTHIMTQAGEAEIGAQRVEQSERTDAVFVDP